MLKNNIEIERQTNVFNIFITESRLINQLIYLLINDFSKQFDEIFLGAKSGSALPREIGSENGSELFLLPKSESGAKL